MLLPVDGLLRADDYNNHENANGTDPASVLIGIYLRPIELKLALVETSSECQF